MFSHSLWLPFGFTSIFSTNLFFFFFFFREHFCFTLKINVSSEENCEEMLTNKKQQQSATPPPLSVHPGFGSDLVVVPHLPLCSRSADTDVFLEQLRGLNPRRFATGPGGRPPGG